MKSNKEIIDQYLPDGGYAGLAGIELRTPSRQQELNKQQKRSNKTL
jgi:hypothetical protein